MLSPSKKVAFIVESFWAQLPNIRTLFMVANSLQTEGQKFITSPTFAKTLK